MRNYIFELSEKVSRRHVRYQNRYGITLAGDLHAAKDLHEGKTY